MKEKKEACLMLYNIVTLLIVSFIAVDKTNLRYKNNLSGEKLEPSSNQTKSKD